MLAWGVTLLFQRCSLHMHTSAHVHYQQIKILSRLQVVLSGVAWHIVLHCGLEKHAMQRGFATTS